MAAHLIAIAGLSGTGKSSLARALTDGLTGGMTGRLTGGAAVHLNSDIFRKALYFAEAGITEWKPTDRLPPDAYRGDWGDRTYREMQRLAAQALSEGKTVICDATFTRAVDRLEIEAVASREKARFSGLWLDLDPEVQLDRVAARTEQDNDVSDATVAVARVQIDRGMERPIDWQRLDSDQPLLPLAAQARSYLGLDHPARPEGPLSTTGATGPTNPRL